MESKGSAWPYILVFAFLFLVAPSAFFIVLGVWLVARFIEEVKDGDSDA